MSFVNVGRQFCCDTRSGDQVGFYLELNIASENHRTIELPKGSVWKEP